MAGSSSPRSLYVSARALSSQTNLDLIFPFVLRSFQFAIRAVPSRSEFYRRISQGASDEKLDTELAKWLKGLNQIVVHMKRFLAEGGYGTV
jgi:hypothetical protein